MHGIKFAILVFALNSTPLLFAQNEAPAAAQQQDQEQAKLPEIKDRGQALELLNHEDYTVRELATSYLLRDDTLDQAGLRELLLKAKTPEQRNRLIYVAEHHVMRIARELDFGPNAANPNPNRRASVGFSYDTLRADENPAGDFIALVVQSTMPGFPAYAYLKPGDVILEINGMDVSNTDRNLLTWVSEQISTKLAGQPISFRIFREGKYQELSMVCAEWTALMQMYSRAGIGVSSRSEQYNRLWSLAYDQLTEDLPGPTPLEAADENN